MPTDKGSAHRLYIRYGKFEAAAHGRWAVVGLLILIAIWALVVLRWLGMP
jgi:hypothetical protein